MNKTLGIAICALLLVPIAAFADTNYSIKSMFNAKTAHVGDNIIITNDDTKPHSITGKDNMGEKIDDTIQPGKSVNLQFLFAGEFAFYDKYDQNVTGVLYIYEPSVDLTKLNVYNHTSVADLYEKPHYETVASVQNVTTSENNTSTNQTISQTMSTPTFESSNATVPIVNPTTSDNQTVQDMKTEITLLQKEVDNYKIQLDNANKQVSIWQQLASDWQNVAERMSPTH